MKFLKFLFSLIYTVLLLYAVFFARRRRHLPERYLNIVPVRNLVKDFHGLTTNRETANYFFDLAGNILLFMPYTFILIILYNYKNNRLVWLSAFLLSISIEVLQYAFQVGVADIDDIILNTAGALVGILLCRQLKKFIPAMQFINH